MRFSQLKVTAQALQKNGIEFSLVFSVFLLGFSFYSLFFVVQSVSVATSIHPTISNAGYLDLVDMKNQIPSDSIIVVFDHSVGYWVRYVDDVDIGQLSPDVWQ